MASREDVHLVLFADNLAGQWMQGHDLLDLITKHLNSDCELFIHRNDLYGIAADAEGASFKCNVIALVLNIHELSKERVSIDRVTDAKADHAIDILLWRTEAIDTRDGRDNDDISTSQERVRCAMSKSFYFGIYR